MAREAAMHAHMTIGRFSMGAPAQGSGPGPRAARGAA